MEKFNDPLERMFKEKFGIYAFDYVQKLIKQLGYNSQDAYDDLQVQMDIIYLDFKKIQMGEWVYVEPSDNIPFLHDDICHALRTVPFGVCSQSERSAARLTLT